MQYKTLKTWFVMPLFIGNVIALWIVIIHHIHNLPYTTDAKVGMAMLFSMVLLVFTLFLGFKLSNILQSWKNYYYRRHDVYGKL